MDRTVFLEARGTVDDFDFETRYAPNHLSPQILWDLWDIGSKWGMLEPRGMFFRQIPLYLELYYSEDKHHPRGLVVARKNKGVITNVMERRKHLTELANGMLVLWDRSITVPEVQEVIEKVDKHAQQEGMKVADERISIDRQSSESAKMIVSEKFAKKDTIIPVLPWQDVDDVVNSFDEPEKLAVMEFGDMAAICLEVEKDLVIQIAIRRIDMLKEMEFEKILELKKKLQEKGGLQ